MATFKAVLNNKPKADGTYTIMIRITQNRKIKHIAVGYAVKKDDWNELKGEVRKSNKLHKVINNAIEQIIIDAKQIATSNKVSAKDVQAGLKNTDVEGSFTEFCKLYAAEFRAKKKYYTADMYESIANKLNSYKQDASFRDITRDFLSGYEVYLISIGNSANTIHKDFSKLKTMYKRAIERGVTETQNPFDKYKVEKSEIHKTKLTGEEIQLIECCELSGDLDTARDIFIFRFYVAGMRIGDCLQLRWGNIVDDRVNYDMNKTGKVKSIILVDQAKKILLKYKKVSESDYVFPYLSQKYSDNELKRQVESKTTLINKALKSIAEVCNINKKITTHVARHSFANIMRKRGASLYGISKALGHSSLLVTENYLDTLDQSDVDNDMLKYLNNT
jgi:integrase/recombinase XerD